MDEKNNVVKKVFPSFLFRVIRTMEDLIHRSLGIAMTSFMSSKKTLMLLQDRCVVFETD